MKVQCINDCFHKGREFRTNDPKYPNGIYNIDVKPGEKLPVHLVVIEEPKVKPAAGKKKSTVSEDEDVLS